MRLGAVQLSPRALARVQFKNQTSTGGADAGAGRGAPFWRRRHRGRAGGSRIVGADGQGRGSGAEPRRRVAGAGPCRPDRAAGPRGTHRAGPGPGPGLDFEVLSELDETVRDQLSEALPKELLARAVAELETDDAAYVMESLEERETAGYPGAHALAAIAPPSSATSSTRRRPPAVSCRRTSWRCRRSGRSGR